MPRSALLRSPLSRKLLGALKLFPIDAIISYRKEVILMPKDKYTKKDAAEETDSGGKETARAWHQAREDAQEEGQLPEREEHKEENTKD